MRFLVDAQLPRILAEELRKEGYYAIHTRDLPGENHTSDAEISWAKNLVILARCKDLLLAKLDSQKSANTCRENARSSNDIKKNDFAIHDFDKTKRRVSRPRVQLSAFSLPVSGLPPSLPLMSPSGLPAAVLARIPSREMSRPAGCLFSLPRSRPAAWFPASARWHVFRSQLSATRNDCKAASAAFATDQLLMPDPSDP